MTTSTQTKLYLLVSAACIAISLMCVAKMDQLDKMRTQIMIIEDDISQTIERTKAFSDAIMELQAYTIPAKESHE